jgi:protein tyrosine/serine phosphatase
MRGPGDVLYNFHWIVPGEAARSAQAYAGFLGPFLTHHGIRTMINLRGNHPKIGWWRYEDRVSAARGVTHLDVMLNSRHLPLRGMLAALFNAFDKAQPPFLIKCSGGQDRTSFAAALYLLHRDGWSARPLAEAQFARFPYLHFPKDHQRWLKPFITFAEQEAKGRPIAEWVRESYDPEQLRDWLNANGFSGSFAGIFALPPGARAQW